MPVRTSSSKLISAVAYYRMSSDKQETSIPDQRRAVERYATEHGYVIIREYCDEGISGDATEKRFAFQKMLAECKAGDFKAVLCWDQDRFGRFDPLEAGYWIRPMREAGVHLVTVAQGEVDWEDFAGRIVWSVTQEGKHAYLRDLSRNVTRGLLAKAKLGEWVAGRPPYGYRLKGKHLFPGPADEVAVIVELFDGYIAGMSCRALAVRLNVAGVASPRGKAWAESTIRKALQNVAYIGTASWNGERAGKYNRVVNGQIEKRLDKGRKQNVDEDAILVPGTHPPIVDRKKFDLVQRLLASRKSLTTPVRGGGGFVLTGLLRCGHCGLAMHGTTEGKQRGCDHKVYRCAGSCEHGRGFCQPNRIRQDALLPCIVAKLKGQLQREFTMKASRDRFRKELQSQLKAKAARPDAKRLQQELTELDAKIARLERRVLDVEDDMLPIVTAPRGSAAMVRAWQTARAGWDQMAV